MSKQRGNVFLNKKQGAPTSEEDVYLRSLIFHPLRLMAELSFEGQRILARDVRLENTTKGYNIELDDACYRANHKDDDTAPKKDEKVDADKVLKVTWKDFKGHGKVVVSHSSPSRLNYPFTFSVGWYLHKDLDPDVVPSEKPIKKKGECRIVLVFQTFLSYIRAFTNDLSVNILHSCFIPTEKIAL